jgi:hypothetical protein
MQNAEWSGRAGTYQWNIGFAHDDIQPNQFQLAKASLLLTNRAGNSPQTRIDSQDFSEQIGVEVRIPDPLRAAYCQASEGADR